MNNFVSRMSLIFGWLQGAAYLELQVVATLRGIFAAEDQLNYKEKYSILSGLFGKFDSVRNFNKVFEFRNLFFDKWILTWWVDLCFVRQGILIEPFGEFYERIFVLFNLFFFNFPSLSSLLLRRVGLMLHVKKGRIWISLVLNRSQKRL